MTVREPPAPEAAGALFRVAGVALEPDPSGALYWPERRLLAVADLHLEKGSAYARKGTLLPPYDSRATLERLRRTLARHDPAVVVCLGDSFHDDGAASRLDPRARRTLRELTARRRWLWVAGNHDPAPPTALGGCRVEAVAAAPLRLSHLPGDGAAGEICGHLHPCATVRVRGRGVRRRCFVTDGSRLVLPAFGAYAGGLDVFEPAFRDLFPGGFEVWLLGRDRVRRARSSLLSVPARLRAGARTASGS